jgi:hypothetical protein
MGRSRAASLLLCAVALIGGHVSASDDDPPTLTRVRGADVDMHRLIREGATRSPAFRSLVDVIQRSNSIVVVGFGFCAKGQFRSCVSHVAGDEQQRHVRIVVNTRTTGDRLLATIAHELQHALEIVSDPNVKDPDSVTALYRKIGIGKCREGLSEFCETDAAQAVERLVLEQLHSAGTAEEH